MNNETSVKLKFINSVTGEKKLEKYEQRLLSIKKVMSSMPNTMNLGGGKTLQVVDKTTSKLNDLDKKIQSSTKSFASLKTILSGLTFMGAATAFSRITTAVSKLSSKSASYIEDLNLMEVAFQGSAREGKSLVNTLSEMYGLDEDSLTRTVGLFKQLANAMGMSDEIGTKLSKTMTQMAIDISSLYNVSFEKATAVLESSLAGQTKPIRGLTGADITQSTLQVTLDTYGIDESVKNLSYLEKRLVIVTSLINQLDESQNDFGRTIESVANQMRIFDQQLQRVGRAFGNVIIPTLAQVLPYLNAILMVTTEVVNAFARFLGFNEEDYDFFGQSTSSLEDLTDELDSANESAEKLKRGLRSFDKLNNITTKDNDTKSSSTVDPKILEMFNNAVQSYDDNLTNVSMKATRIRDAIMETLGFHRELNKETGKWEYVYEGLGTTVKNLWEKFKALPGIWKSLIALGVLKSTVNLFTTIKSITSLIGSKIPKNLSTLSSLLKGDLKNAIKGKNSDVKTSIDLWSKELTTMDKVKNVLIGAGGLIIGYGLLDDAMKNLIKNGPQWNNILEGTAGALSNIASGALIGGSLGGGIGAAIGASVGTAITALETLWTKLTYDPVAEQLKKDLEDINDTSKAIQNTFRTTYENLVSSTFEVDRHQELLTELQLIVDANGKVKEGYEDRATFIAGELSRAYGIEISLTDGIIKNYDKTIEKIEEQIRLNKIKIQQELFEEEYKNVLTQIKSARENVTKAEEKYKEAVEKGTVAEQESALSALTDAKKVYNTQVKYKDEYEQYMEAYYKKDYDAMNKHTVGLQDLSYQMATGITYNIVEMTEETLEEIDILKDESLKKLGYIDEATSKRIEAKEKELGEMIGSTLTSIDEITPDIVKKWVGIKDKSNEAYTQGLLNISDPNVRKKLEENVSKYENNIIRQITKDWTAKSPTLKLILDPVISKSSSWLDTLSSGVSSVISAISSASTKTSTSSKTVSTRANGGLPPVGQLFVANEKGPELVSHIGGQSFVANQRQIEGLMEKNFGGKSSQPINITVINKVDSDEVSQKTLSNLQDMASANGKPIVIGN